MYFEGKESKTVVAYPAPSRPSPIVSGDKEISPEKTVIQEEVVKLPLLSKDDILARYKIAQKIPTTTIRSTTLQDLSKRSADSGFLEMALEIADSIPTTTIRSVALSNLSEKSGQADNIDLALKIAEKIPTTTIRSEALRGLAIKSAQSGDIKLAMMIAEKIPTTTIRSNTLSEISNI